MNLILAITSLLPYGLHAIWLNMEPIEKQMMQSINLFTDKFLIAISLILAANSEAKIDLETAMGIWLLDENKDNTLLTQTKIDFAMKLFIHFYLVLKKLLSNILQKLFQIYYQTLLDNG